MSHRYARHANHLAAAAPGGTVLAIGVGLIAVEVAFRYAPAVLGLLMAGRPLPDGYYTGSSPWGMILGLLSFAVGASALAIVVKRGFGRPFSSLLGDPARVVVDGVAVVRVLAVVLAAVYLLDVLGAMATAPNIRPFGSWLMFGMIALPAIFIQTSTEELIYRGFLQQQLGLMSRNPLVWMCVPSLLFGVAHIGYSTDWVENSYYVGWTFCFGMICADLTARSGSLGPALAVHFIYNTYTFLLIGWWQGPNSGLALFLYPLEILGESGEVLEVNFVPDEGGLLVLAVAMIWQYLPLLILWLGARVALRR